MLNSDYINDLKKLSFVKSNSGVKLLPKGASPGKHCPMHTSIKLTNSIKGVSSLIVGTQECATYSRMVVKNSHGKDGELHWTYVLDSNEVVFGCRDGLIDALIEMDKHGAKAIMIIVTCVPELIGEDIESVIYEIQDSISAKLMFVMVGHFKCNGYPSGIWKSLKAFASIMDEKEVLPNRINILSENKSFLNSPLIKEIIKNEIYINHLGMRSSLEDFMEAPKALLNIVLTASELPLAQEMKVKFGTPYVSLHNIYSIEEVDEAYKEISECIGVELKGIFNEERNELIKLEEEIREKVKGIKYVTTDSNLDPIPMSIYLAKMGMEPLLLHIEEFYEEDKKLAKKLVDLGHNPFVCHIVSNLAGEFILENLQPEFSFGAIHTKENKNIPSLSNLHRINGSFGYECTINLLRSIITELDKGGI
ncbi:nitrogenase component 1 [Clostridium sp. SHJSY1]|uniref:nitrogenase component 1 n=1 Tax=Clostridium sp. SHJSY1 TaxID=2942483 RepID=UPI0028766058|nr:nitrogenase component 1 [Clostridium sp. SHJSY1]MDS0527402.1 nitrogenase component 1 [Clostridium sp. SHJSY1]